MHLYFYSRNEQSNYKIYLNLSSKIIRKKTYSSNSLPLREKESREKSHSKKSITPIHQVDKSLFLITEKIKRFTLILEGSQ